MGAISSLSIGIVYTIISGWNQFKQQSNAYNNQSIN